MSSESGSRIAKTICNMCSTHCGIDVHVEDGKIVGVTGMEEHPNHTLCIKAKAIPELVHSSERLTNPLKKVDGKFKEISWDEAFDLIASKLIEGIHPEMVSIQHAWNQANANLLTDDEARDLVSAFVSF